MVGEPIVTVTERTIPRLCDVCGGNGFQPRPGYSLYPATCGACKGEGWVSVAEKITTTSYE